MTRPILIERLVCFLVGHDLQHYCLVCRNQSRLVCCRCGKPYADTLDDKWQLMKRHSETRKHVVSLSLRTRLKQ